MTELRVPNSSTCFNFVFLLSLCFGLELSGKKRYLIIYEINGTSLSNISIFKHSTSKVVSKSSLTQPSLKTLWTCLDFDGLQYLHINHEFDAAFLMVGVIRVCGTAELGQICRGTRNSGNFLTERRKSSSLPGTDFLKNDTRKGFR